MIRSFSARGLGIPVPNIDEWLDGVASAGFESIDLPLRDLHEIGQKPCDFARSLERRSLSPGACPFPFDWRGDRESFERIITALKPVLEFAAEAGVTRMYTRVAESVPEGSEAEEVLEIHRERLCEIANLIAPFGMNLGLETVGVESFRKCRPPLMHTLAAVRSELAEVFENHDNVGLLVDAFHLYAAEESLDDALGPFAGRVVGVHVADLPKHLDSRSDIVDHERALPGTTDQVPVREILKGLRELGCNAPVIVETVRCPAELVDRPFSDIARKTFEVLTAQWF